MELNLVLSSVSATSFCGKPQNYAKINGIVSRSAQPTADDFIWLRKQGVTDIVNFRIEKATDITFDEKKLVESLGMRYHFIPSVTYNPNSEKIKKFLKLTDGVAKKGGKVHIHCKAGSDRTGMYAFLYKMYKRIGTQEENVAEWLKMGHNNRLFPDLIGWAKKFAARRHWSVRQVLA